MPSTESSDQEAGSLFFVGPRRSQASESIYSSSKQTTRSRQASAEQDVEKYSRRASRPFVKCLSSMQRQFPSTQRPRDNPHRAKRADRCNASQRLGVDGFITVLCRLAARAFSLLLKQYRNCTQSFVHLLSGSELAGDVSFQNDDISTFGISCGVLAPYAFTEVIFWPHRIFVPRWLPSSSFFHSSSVLPSLLAVHL